jgi:hypothetical protein
MARSDWVRPLRRPLVKVMTVAMLGRLRVKKLFGLVFFLSSLGIGATNASACQVVGPQYQLQSDTVEWQMSAHFGETCRRGVRFKLISNPTIKIIASPQFGSLTVQGPSFSYTAGPDFHDQDSFRVEVSGFIGHAGGTSTVHVAVSNTAPTTSSQSQPQPRPGD